ncbi:hypothetical protein TPHA_0B04600 [Tetrapisispora phaffii CBS 4417]|uniref:Endonuclease/exonuclease/phosphatase domain-containing protein n=1 Tax=Tetrapisispora phaffii (strain ATCC 24235 / CBS 4417 / NBRC 1672 / NRRL Y-8282 / UCD 70-5) TaxID=1071381 RepID=G8BQ48_TETPH|nr:hypothetical protein TPHA_0B04600 [Tetrapisispora phaffii CBS 4417]CCE62129.1 hypothetical protein TPHA_0B04600 [Tetrapisispora phaffii CBS 4417]
MSKKSNPRVSFLTFNTWGLKWVSKFREERLRAIADAICGHPGYVESLQGAATVFGDGSLSNEYDIIALQEIWCKSDWDYIVEKCGHLYPYNRIFYSGILTGPGLAILSKIPIESTFLYRFPINGRPSAFLRGDWYVGKSIAITLLKPVVEGSTPLAIMNSHMHAPYSLTGDANYHCHRACQAWDFSKLANLYKKAGYAVVIVGDLNSRPGSLQHRFLTEETNLIDSWEQLKGKQDITEIASLPPLEQLKEGCCTCDSTLNTWRPKCKPTDACRLDYALIDGEKLRTIDAGVRFTERLPNIGSYSDHFAYSCTLEIAFQDSSIVGSSEETLDNYTNTEMSTLKHRIANYNELVDVIDTYMNTARNQKFYRGLHFVLSIVALVFLLVKSFDKNSLIRSNSSWLTFIWILLVIAISATGTIDGLISFLFGRKEIRALTEVKYEVLDAKCSLSKATKKQL